MPLPSSPGNDPGIVELIKDINLIFKKHDIYYWLEAGSLLKAIRDSTLVSGDLDLACWQTDIHKIVTACEDLKKMGFRCLFQGGLNFVEDCVKISIPDRYQVPYGAIDIYIYAILNDEALRRNIHRPAQKIGKKVFRAYKKLSLNNVSKESLKGRLFNLAPRFLKSSLSKVILKIYVQTCQSMWYVVPLSYFKDFKDIQLCGFTFNVPVASEAYMKYRYGDNWKIPSKNWRFADGEYLRFRRMRQLPQNKTKRIKVYADLSWPRNRFKPIRRTYHFSEEEIAKIRSLK
jgi:phosphorylcholine metabolism protein LicD